MSAGLIHRVSKKKKHFQLIYYYKLKLPDNKVLKHKFNKTKTRETTYNIKTRVSITLIKKQTIYILSVGNILFTSLLLCMSRIQAGNHAVLGSTIYILKFCSTIYK